MSRATRRLLLLLPLLGLAAFSLCVGSPAYYREKYAPAAEGVRPAALPKPIAPEVQTEAHTCGLHALSSVYTAYGLDPAALRLRFRLGTDKPASTLVSDSTGTIHPDMLRVLGQDGFETSVLRPGGEQTPRRLREHLDAGHPALALTKPSGFHWVVVAGREGESVLICDSLAREKYARRIEDYLRDEVCSLLLLEPEAER